MRRKVVFRKSKKMKSRVNIKKRRRTYRKKRGGCNQCIGSDYKSDGQWTSGPMKGGGQYEDYNQDYSKYMLDSTPYSVS